MIKQIIPTVLGTVILLWSNSAFSYYKETETTPNGNKPTQAQNSEAKGANCAPSTAKLTLQFNDVSALIEQGGSMFQDRNAGTAAYEVPKGSGLRAIYAGALWMGGVDVNGQLKLAALKFRSGNDFWPGPLTANPATQAGPGQVLYDPLNPVGDNAIRIYGEATIEPNVCLEYDKFYTIRKAEVISFSVWWDCSQDPSLEGCDEVEAPDPEVLNRIYNWPAHGNVDLGQDFYLAPFYDRDEDGTYNPDNGDYPWYDDILNRDDVECGFDRRITLFGDETHWWVFNDKGNIHTETNGEPIGMEIRAQAFAFATNDEVNRMTFYNYELINRGTQTLYDTYFSQYIDADIGNYQDDYAGCDVSRGLGYMLNGDLLDETNGGNLGYGENPPAIGCDFFEGPYQDADGVDNPGPYYDAATDTDVVPTVSDALAQDGIVYKGIGIGYSDGIIDNERFGMRRFIYYTGFGGNGYPYTDPGGAAEYYNYMSGSWQNGEEIVFGGLGFASSTGATTVPTDYVFPGDSDPLDWATSTASGAYTPAPFSDWSEETNNNPPGDRRFVQSAGPFTLVPGAINNITVGIVYGRGTDGDLFSGVRAMKSADTKAQALFDACFRILDPPNAPKVTIQELENQLVIMLDNPATSNNFNETYAVEDEINITDPTVDRFYRFEGYQIYQMSDDEVGVSDIGDPNKARLVAQCDLKNGIDRLINFEFNEALGYSIPVEKVDGADEGIKHTFLLTEDAFAQGDRQLVNHKTYYYIAVAYAYNNFKNYDPNDPLALDGQKIPYISSRLNFDGSAISSIPAVPHNPMPEADGTGQNIEYGSSPIITRLDGHGNGGRVLEFTQSTLDAVIASGKVDNPSYDYGSGPINVKVVDPLNVEKGYYELSFTDYNPSSINGADTASWVINRYDNAQKSNLLGTVTSSLDISNDNEQVIPEWGISVQINQKLYFLPDGVSSGTPQDRITEMLDATIEFADSSRPWLSFIPDNNAFFPTNWVRSGDYFPDSDPNSSSYECLDNTEPGYADYFDPCFYPDQVGADPNRAFNNILGGGVAPHRVAGYESSYMPMAYYNYPAVTTAKKRASISYLPSVDIVITSDKSKWTRCPVIELGRDASLNVEGAQPGQMRKSPSVNKEGNSLNDGTTGMGWFPGYAVELESGVRLYMAFGENSFLASDNGADMIWNPSERVVDNQGTPIMGGLQPVYVFGYNNKTTNGYALSYDFPAYYPWEGEDINTNAVYQHMLDVEANNATVKRDFYSSISWVLHPRLTPDQQQLATDAKIRLRVSKEYKNYTGSGENAGAPMYSWSMDDVGTDLSDEDRLIEAIDLINVVPNPYYAYSEYERTRLDTRVKITNLPERCEVNIYTTNGKLVRTFKKDSPVTSIDWDLNNWKAIPVAGGVYLIHVEIKNENGDTVGDKVVKFFGGMRQVDLQGI